MALTYDEKVHLAKKIRKTLQEGKGKEMRECWKDNFLILGHKVLGRLVIGQAPDEAVHKTKAEKEA